MSRVRFLIGAPLTNYTRPGAQPHKRRRPGPRCPKCRGPVVLRVRQSDGAPFLGCQRYPTCTGSRAVPASKKVAARAAGGPPCPDCSAPTRLAVAGATKTPFLACSRFPACAGTIPIPPMGGTTQAP